MLGARDVTCRFSPRFRLIDLPLFRWGLCEPEAQASGCRAGVARLSGRVFALSERTPCATLVTIVPVGGPVLGRRGRGSCHVGGGSPTPATVPQIRDRSGPTRFSRPPSLPSLTMAGKIRPYFFIRLDNCLSDDLWRCCWRETSIGRWEWSLPAQSGRTHSYTLACPGAQSTARHTASGRRRP